MVDILKLRKLQKKNDVQQEAEKSTGGASEELPASAPETLENQTTATAELPEEKAQEAENAAEDNAPDSIAAEREKAETPKTAEAPKGLSIKELLAKKKAEKEREAAAKEAEQAETAQAEFPPVIIDDADFDEPKPATKENNHPTVIIDDADFDKVTPTEKESLPKPLIDDADFDEPQTQETSSGEKPQEKQQKTKEKTDESKLNRFADEKNDEHLENIKLVTFKLSEQRFGIPIDSVQEVVKLIEITRVPNVAYYIIGVINLRGIITPVADLRKRLHLDEAVLTKHSRIIVLTIDGQAIGFLVDAIADILTTSKNDIQPAPPLVSNIDSRYIMGVVDPKKEETSSTIEQLVIVLDLAQIFIPSEEAGEKIYA